MLTQGLQNSVVYRVHQRHTVGDQPGVQVQLEVQRTITEAHEVGIGEVDIGL